MHKSKTIWFAFALTCLGAVQANTDILALFLTPVQQGAALSLIGIIVAALRFVTTTAISEK